jgi:hypothetical protein
MKICDGKDITLRHPRIVYMRYSCPLCEAKMEIYLLEIDIDGLRERIKLHEPKPSITADDGRNTY